MEQVSHEFGNNQPIAGVETWNVVKLLSTRHLYIPLALVCSLQAGQQFSGINAVSRYPIIFKAFTYYFFI